MANMNPRKVRAGWCEVVAGKNGLGEYTKTAATGTRGAQESEFVTATLYARREGKVTCAATVEVEVEGDETVIRIFDGEGNVLLVNRGAK